jgi:hypothetical protein
MPPTPLDVANRAENPLPERRPRRRRRRPVPEARRCARDGCNRPGAQGGYGHCSTVCALLDRELSELENLCREAGNGLTSTEAWTSLVEIADAWSEYVRVRGCVNQMAYDRSTADRRADLRGLKT